MKRVPQSSSVRRHGRASGNPAADGALIDSDFEVLEDGVPQSIANFARDADLPLRMVMLYDTSLSVAQRLSFERRLNRMPTPLP